MAIEATEPCPDPSDPTAASKLEGIEEFWFALAS